MKVTYLTQGAILHFPYACTKNKAYALANYTQGQ